MLHNMSVSHRIAKSFDRKINSSHQRMRCRQKSCHIFLQIRHRILHCNVTTHCTAHCFLRHQIHFLGHSSKYCFYSSIPDNSFWRWQLIQGNCHKFFRYIFIYYLPQIFHETVVFSLGLDHFMIRSAISHTLVIFRISEKN